MRPLLLCLLLAVPAAAGGPRLRSAKLRRAVAAVQPAVVKVFGLKGFRGVYGYRTGVIVHESGLVITRGSVTLDEAEGRIRCHLHDGRRLLARIVREDRRSRMVLLRLVDERARPFPTARLGSSSGVRPGQFVVLIGNAYRTAQGSERCAVNLGMVSAVTPVRLRSGLSDFPYDRPVILHDAINNPGVYGGPLVDLGGRVIGISGNLVESSETNAQVHYAVPIDDLKDFIRDTVARPDAPRIYSPPRVEEKDEGPAGYHGIRMLRGGINRATPAYVDRVDPGSPAFRAGVRPDDLILRLDETEIKSWRSFQRVIGRYRAGHKVRLTVKRGDAVEMIRFELTAEGPQ
ncbi:MAG: S1C family serine protease [Planctomycetota bacterium]